MRLWHAEKIKSGLGNDLPPSFSSFSAKTLILKNVYSEMLLDRRNTMIYLKCTNGCLISFISILIKHVNKHACTLPESLYQLFSTYAHWGNLSSLLSSRTAVLKTWFPIPTASTLPEWLLEKEYLSPQPQSDRVRKVTWVFNKSTG